MAGEGGADQTFKAAFGGVGGHGALRSITHQPNQGAVEAIYCGFMGELPQHVGFSGFIVNYLSTTHQATVKQPSSNLGSRRPNGAGTGTASTELMGIGLDRDLFNVAVLLLPDTEMPRWRRWALCRFVQDSGELVRLRPAENLGQRLDQSKVLLLPDIGSIVEQRDEAQVLRPRREVAQIVPNSHHVFGYSTRRRAIPGAQHENQRATRLRDMEIDSPVTPRTAGPLCAAVEF